MNKAFLKYCVVIIITFLVDSSAEAQILNIERQRTEADTSNVWLGNTTFTLSVRKQNVNVVNFNWATNVSYLSLLHNYSFISNINLFKVSGKDVISDAYMHGRINFYRQRELSYEAFAQHQYDKSRGLERRVLVGAGLRWKFAQANKITMSFGPGIMHEQEEWVQPESVVNDYRTENFNFFKTTTYLSLRWDPNTTYSLNTISYYQARLNKLFSPRFSGEINFSTKINSHLLFTSKFVAQYDALPVVPIEKVTYAFTNGVTFKF